ncbi:PAS domain-containing sensor histidine kinase [Rhodoferax koreense]|uniref:histidine kinase n=1 Tax=Rhodoferax koreensis TaxID=1842727 RepID=A0A1P8K4G3_9BURK|nr:ATP-binding protein [Rhodoferax koreense]APW40903.1 PAS domain-containing sensor histidine kinase [Rhodoferax koreense]
MTGADPDHLPLVRVWYGFMTARVTIALAILALQGSLFALGQAVPVWLVLGCGAYFASTLGVRFLARPEQASERLAPFWGWTIGVDAVVFCTLQILQSGNINYAPLLGVPVLLAAVLGSRAMALGTAAGMTLLLLLEAWWMNTQGAPDGASRLLQSGLTGLGYFVAAFLVNQLAARLVREQQIALRSQMTARLQTHVNELVIETLADGVVVIDAGGITRTLNPAARLLLGSGESDSRTPLVLASRPAWQPLLKLAQQTFEQESAQAADITIVHPGKSPRRVRARTRLTIAHEVRAESLCVMFLHDLREMEARLRTEKMAAMGRMSAAVAHEIRNPLAAISQANALLEEDLTDAGHKRLTGMVRQNAQRLSKIVDEVLGIARVQHPGVKRSSPVQLVLDETVDAVCRDWSAQDAASRHGQLVLTLGTLGLPVDFDPDHLQRVLINLLDNALRYVNNEAGAIQVSTRLAPSRQSSLQVWSDGPPMEQAVEQHLFEPFFSSESRSSGLGLYICRELCERHRAVIGYQRATRERDGRVVQGNEFYVNFRPPKPSAVTGDLFGAAQT